jgi:RHS repeat-associated protein
MMQNGEYGGVYSSTLAKYYYDANGARAKTDESGTIFRYVYSGHDPMYYNTSDGKGYNNIYLGGRQEVRIVSPSEKWIYAADALGSTRKVLQNGRPGSATFSAVTYKPFGPVITTTGSDKFTYAGEIQDSPTGLVYLSARYYDPALGRFYALDPELGKVSSPQTMNRYAYCGNNPIIFTDPTGKNWLLLGLMFVCGIAGGISGAIDAYEHHDSYGACIAAGAISWSTFPVIWYATGKDLRATQAVGIPAVSAQVHPWRVQVMVRPSSSAFTSTWIRSFVLQWGQ